MAYRLSSSIPPERAIPLGGNATLWVRPAEMFEQIEAEQNAVQLLAGLITGQDAAMRATAMLGRQFRDADFTDRAWAVAAQQCILLLELATLCATRWEGVLGDDDKPIEKPTREYLALLLRDCEAAKLVSAALHAKIHEEISEKNGSAASLNGGAGHPATADAATSSTSRVPEA
jgi:hypothetical protein